MRIVLASLSQHKMGPVKSALEEYKIDHELVLVDAASGVSPQPRNEETLQGARNRLKHAKAAVPDADLYVAIESGLFDAPQDTFLDKAAIVVETSDGAEFIAYSGSVEFPASSVKEAMEIGFDKITVGKVMHAAGIVAQHDDPHFSLTGKSRAAFLKETFSNLLKCISEIKMHKQLSADSAVIFDDSIRRMVSDIETPAINQDLDSSLQKLIQALTINCQKPAVQARYLKYQQVEDNCLGLVQETIRYPLDSEGYALSFDPLQDEQSFWNCWSTFGFIVGKSVISKTLCDATVARVNDIAHQLSAGQFSIQDPATHGHMPVDKDKTPLISRGFFEIYHDNSLAQLRQSLRVYLHHVMLWGRTDLWTTFDRYGVKLAGHAESKGLPLHVDQNPTVQMGFETLQGVLALVDCPVERGTFVAVPGSYHAFKEYEQVVKAHERKDYRGEYVELMNNPPQEEVLQNNKQLIPLHAGDMVSWDSRTTHANSANTSGKSRLVAYISAGPAQEHQAHLVAERRNSFLNGLGKNVREARLHASMKPRFTDQAAVNKIREPEELTLLGDLLYGRSKF